MDETSSERGSGAHPRNPINDLYRLADIKRWHIVRTSQDQSVAEHSYFVTLLAMRIASVIGAPIGQIVHYALLHDAEECWTGDIPSPVKHSMGESTLPIREMMGDMFIEPNSLTKTIVKICDIAESIKFLNKFAADKHGVTVRENLVENIASFMEDCSEKFPSYDWQLVIAELNEYYKDNQTHIDDYVRERL